MIEKLYSNTNNATTNLSSMHTTMHPTALTTTIYTKDYDVPLRHHTKKIYAKAIYDNIAESPDELAFKKGDILNVIEQDTDGLEGWWLCTLRGRQGICPGNRLRIINSYDSGCFSPSPSSSPCPSLGASTATLNSSILSSSDTYENTSSIMLCQQQQQQQQQRHGKRRSWHTSPHKVITPQKCGDVYLYDILSPRNNSPYQNLSIMSDPEAYDIPKPATPVNYDCPKNWNTNNKQQFHSKLLTNTNDLSSLRSQNDDSYDIPRPVNLLHQQDMTPSSSNSSLLTPDSLSLSSSNRSSLANMPDYDIPRRNPQSIRTSQNLNQNHHGTYDFPNNQQQQQQQHQHQSQFDKTTLTPIVPKELPLELSSALETLAKLQTEATSAVTRLLAFVTPNWRTREKLEPILMDVKLAAVRLRTALHDLSEFGEGTLGNATRADDKNLSLKLQPLVKALRDADKLVHECSQQIDKHGWTLENLLRLDNNKTTTTQTMTQHLHHHHNYHQNHQPKDSLDQLIACAQTLTEDVRQIASFIQGNATLLFKRIPSSISLTPITPTSTLSNNNEWSSEDYDYISLETKDNKNKFELKDKNNDKLTDIQQQHQQQQQQSTINSNYNNKNTILNSNDKLLIKYYTAQIITHMGFLTDAIDSFLETVERNQPPKFFIAYGKFVVLSAHNLVSIGDIVHRNLIKHDIKQRVQQYTDALSDALKTCVTKSKKAAQHFPSVTAVQEMVDSVVDISHLARDLKVAMLQAVQV